MDIYNNESVNDISSRSFSEISVFNTNYLLMCIFLFFLNSIYLLF